MQCAHQIAYNFVTQNRESKSEENNQKPVTAVSSKLRNKIIRSHASSESKEQVKRLTEIMKSGDLTEKKKEYKQNTCLLNANRRENRSANGTRIITISFF